MALCLALGAVFATSARGAEFSQGPGIGSSNSNYVSNRKPLRGTPFVKLPVGSIEPKGWLLECLKRQRNGLAGNLGSISAWLQKEDNAWLSKDGSGKWGWEEVPYWLKGYGDLGYVLHDRQVIAETKRWIEAVLAGQRENGDFGPTQIDERGVEDFWPKMLMLYCLESYYEHSSDKRVMSFMRRFFRYQLAYPEDKFLQMYWQSRRSGDNLHSVLWLYNITGEDWLLELARKIHHKGVDWTPRKTAPQDWFRTMPDWHNVNIAQGFREPAENFQLSKDPKDLKASYDAFRTVREYFGQVPGGMFGADENARPGYSDPRQAVETCGMVEQMNSDEELLRITGDVFWADHAEDVAFNTYPVALMPDFRSLRYLTSPNMVLNDDKNHHPGIANSGPFLMMNPFSSRCCQHNHGQGWPYFSENLWQATSDNGAAAVIYSASEVSMNVAKGVPVRIALESRYPFEETLRFRVRPAKSVQFPLYLRVPGWCARPTLKINGVVTPIGGSHGPYIKILRTWNRGDMVLLQLPMTLATTTWTKNHDSVSVNYGPLTFSLRIGERLVRKESTATAIGDSKWQKGADSSQWPSFEIHPTTPWNFGLILDHPSPFQLQRRPWPADNYPFTPGASPLALLAKGKRIPEWKIDATGLCGVLSDSPISSAQPVENIELIPMGAARLRISAFPVIGVGPSAKSWVAK